jgi:leucyl-tRNA synthetase
MARNFDHKALEKKWQAEWEKQKLYETRDSVPGKENLYTLVEFPYPSGDLHVGHWYAYAVPDMFARMKRMQGYNVLFPFGYDEFGLPAENAAIKRGINPADWIEESVTGMEAQMKTMGATFDWSRTVRTSSPGYMRWTQWLFLKFYEKGIAYRGKGKVNWCPVDQTVLANEQVIDGKCERCGSEVVQKDMEQWFMKITGYADRLLEDLEPLKWPNAIKESQRNWIGRKIGINIAYEIEGTKEAVVCFTTRPDTNFGATFVVIAPEHSFAQKVSQDSKEVAEYIGTSLKKTELERQQEGKKKTGVFTGFYAINNLNGRKLPIWVSDFVLAGFGTGAVVGVPGHDIRDFEFATTFDIPVVRVVVGPDRDTSDITKVEQVQEEVGHMVNSEFLDGLDIHEATQKVMDYLEEKGWGKRTKTYRFRDWLISRQRYWGAPIPIVYDPEGRAHPIPEEHLPWLLPLDADIKPKGTSPLGSSKELAERTEKLFGKGWRPETDTMDGFVDNSWYFLRYLDPKNKAEFASMEKQKTWMPIARYSGGAEHTTVHVLYSRFFIKTLYDMGLATVAEPYTERMNRGIILAEDGRKMSKRWGNVVNPDEEVERVGADAVRMYLAFIGPYNEVGSFPWSTNGLVGVRKFLERVAGLRELVADEISVSDEILLNQSIKKVGDDIESFKFNTSVSQLMILSNSFIKAGAIARSEFETFLKLLAPFAPHLAEELWSELGHKSSIHLESWPSYDDTKLVADVVTLAVQINGKTRGTIEIGRNADETDALSIAKSDSKIAKYLPPELKKIVYVSGRILNIIG